MRILLAEDEVDLARGLAKFLRSLGHTVRRAEDGKNALRLLRERVYEVAIIDLVLPKLDGVQLIYKIHQRKCKGRPIVIVITAFPSKLPVPNPEHYGVVCEVLRKPKELNQTRLRRAIVYCEEIWEERKDRERGAEVYEKLIAKDKFKHKKGQIAVVNIEKQECRLFNDEREAVEYAKRYGGKRPYFRYFDSKLYGTLRRVQK